MEPDKAMVDNRVVEMRAFLAGSHVRSFWKGYYLSVYKILTAGQKTKSIWMKAEIRALEILGLHK